MLSTQKSPLNLSILTKRFNDATALANEIALQAHTIKNKNQNRFFQTPALQKQSNDVTKEMVELHFIGFSHATEWLNHHRDWVKALGEDKAINLACREFITKFTAEPPRKACCNIQ